MAQVEQYKGKLGFKHRSEEKLALALTELVDTLEDFGHPALQIHAREPHRIGLDTDQYKVTLRLRRIPLRLGVRTPKGVPVPAAYIELVMTPVFPQNCDQEISEIMLAMILRRLTETLDPLVIFWQETAKALAAKEFLGAFERETPLEVEPLVASPAMVIADTSSRDLAADQTESAAATALMEAALETAAQHSGSVSPRSAEADRSQLNLAPSAPAKPATKTSSAEDRLRMADQARAEAEAERTRGQERFGAVETTSPLLEQQCDKIEQGQSTQLSRSGRRITGSRRRTHTSYQSVFGKSRLDWLLAPPRALVSASANALRSVDLVLSLRAVMTAMVVLFLHGSGMVQAAARVLLP